MLPHCGTLFICFLITVQVLCKPSSNKDSDEDGDIEPFPNRKANQRSEKELKEEIDADYWKKHALATVQDKILRKINQKTAKNIVMFLGDGMSIPTISATRVYLGGEEKQLSFEKFPYTGLSKTYCVDHQVPDSACTATAYLGGVKANLGTVGVSAAVKKRNCTAMNNIDNHIYSIARLFQLKGKSSGLVTTTRVTHASPAGVYAHTASRQWECDTNVLNHDENPSECEDIAHQLVFGETGQNLNVILGGGRKKFLPKEITDEEGNKGQRSDHISLVEEWKTQKEARRQSAEYIWNREQLFNVSSETKFILGLFEASHMAFNLQRNRETDPSLEEMTEAAIKILSKDDKGFFLFVEGGRIDSAHHQTWAQMALDETAELDKAVKKAIAMTNEEDTLIVVTSDHAHTMSYAGHAARGSHILGYGGMGMDNVPYPILSYANGPGYKPKNEDGSRYVPTVEEMNEVTFRYPSNAPVEMETHGGDDVAIFARGPWAHLFTGVLEENVIPHLLAYAACVSTDISCDDRTKLA